VLQKQTKNWYGGKIALQKINDVLKTLCYSCSGLLCGCKTWTSSNETLEATEMWFMRTMLKMWIYSSENNELINRVDTWRNLVEVILTTQLGLLGCVMRR